MSGDRRHPLFLICGPSGAGKTTLADWLVAREPAIVRLQKAVTRSLRPGEEPGPEVVVYDEAAFAMGVAIGTIVASYRKYGDQYGLLATCSTNMRTPAGTYSVRGVDALESGPAVTVGDAYEAPKAMAQVAGKLVVVVLYARLQTIVQRIFGKAMSHFEREVRLSTIDREFQEGFPANVDRADLLLCTDEPTESAGRELLSAVQRHL